ncbi:hypothetical protein FKM82_003262 [Ascaphus truei]
MEKGTVLRCRLCSIYKMSWDHGHCVVVQLLYTARTRFSAIRFSAIRRYREGGRHVHACAERGRSGVAHAQNGGFFADAAHA